MSYSFYLGYEYNASTDTYVNTFRIEEPEVINSTFMQADFPDYDVLEMSVKPLSKLTRLVGETNAQKRLMKPLIIAKAIPNDIDNRILWFSFVVARERREINSEDVIYFKGVDFKYFDTMKIVPSNFGWSTIDPDDLPDDYKRFRYTSTYDNVMNMLYDYCYINPRTIQNGGVVSISSINRKFKGLQSHSSVTGLAGSKTFNSTQNNLSELKQELNSLFSYEPVFKQRIVNGKIQITHEKPVEISQQIINSSVQIKEKIYGVAPAANMIVGTADAPIYKNIINYSRDYWEFTSQEKEIDYSFIAGSNQDYLTAPMNTEMSKEEKNRVFKYHKIDIVDQFTIFNVGNIVRLDGIRYRIRRIQETKSASTFTVDVDIEEV